MKFSEEFEARFAEMVPHYPTKRSALVPTLLYAQDEVGFLSDEVITEIAGRLHLTELEVRNVISYYSMLTCKPRGKYNVQVCTNISCMQNRWGPTRVGPFGLLQPAADGIKFLFKEDLTPPHVYKPLFLAAPLIAVVFALTSIAVIPFGNSITLFGYSFPLQITTDVNTGLLLILGVTSIGVYGVALAGWSSNNKYSLLGGLRASAQMVSYEISLGLSLVGVLILAGSFSLTDIVHAPWRRW